MFYVDKFFRFSFQCLKSVVSFRMRVLELYSGIGGMHFALRESGVEGDVVAAVDINPVANDVYKENFPKVSLMNRNIQSLSIKDIESFNIDTVLMSPPCQPFTRLGLQKDASDNRSSSLFYVLKLIPQIRTLKYILLENVKGFESSQTRQELLKCLRACQFNYKELILSPSQFGIPNTRHRYYLLAKRNDLKFHFDRPELEHSLPSRLLESFSQNKQESLVRKDDTNNLEDTSCYKLSEILESCDESLYLIPRNILQKRALLLDVRTSDSRGSCCFTKGYSRYVEGTGSVYCPFSKEVVQEKYEKFKECEEHSEEKLQFLLDLRLRYFTPKEVSRLMSFPKDFEFPIKTVNKQRYKLLGNSINVYVVSKLIFLLHSETERI